MSIELFFKKILPSLLIQVCIFFLFFIEREKSIFFFDGIENILDVIGYLNIVFIGFLASYKSEKPIFNALLAGGVLYFIWIPILVLLECFSLMFNARLNYQEFLLTILGVYISGLFNFPQIFVLSIVGGLINKFIKKN